MKKIVIALLFAALASCGKDGIETYSGTDMVNFKDSLPQTHTFGYDGAEVTKATIEVQVDIIGRVVDYPRTVELVQVAKQGLENPAVEGRHFVFDQKDKWVIPAGATTAMLPITLLRDASLNDGVWNLRLAVTHSAHFEVGDVVAQQKTISFSGKLLKPAFWDVNMNYSLGQWSERKQLFMYAVCRERIDQTWFTDSYSQPNAASHYQAMFRNALFDFNTNLANIASGEAPMKDENGAVISF